MDGDQMSKNNMTTIKVSPLCGLDEQEAIMCLAYIIMGTHNFTPEEINSYQAMARKFCSAELDLMKCQDKFHDMLRDHKNEKIIKDCIQVIREKYRETVFAWLVDGVAADDHYTYDEEDYIILIRDEIGMSKERANLIMDVMTIKNKKYKSLSRKES
ncbi:hypothetical protein E7Z59_05155 [Robertkochia marina]|uniref:Co-chaperone DjlA N-terminal domain-containing protein n=1 Tax=Robertkochia marina TaxID=1227945 RepID=A0A4S3M670_9FLAO|nr:hypothetical protein [Robertkochia marina]THD69717.1 hypothetical protein E7Z59_05155 [Robertkochia marina]TRZ46940.1 hypothetical protein D3A96_05060 [Robertkochia marina]